MKSKIKKFIDLTDWKKLWNFLITTVCFYAAFEHPLWIVFKYKITGINYILNIFIIYENNSKLWYLPCQAEKLTECDYILHTEFFKRKTLKVSLN